MTDWVKDLAEERIDRIEGIKSDIEDDANKRLMSFIYEAGWNRLEEVVKDNDKWNGWWDEKRVSPETLSAQFNKLIIDSKQENWIDIILLIGMLAARGYPTVRGDIRIKNDD